MQRSPSMEFKDLTKKDAQISLSTELDKLMMTSPAGVRDQVEQNMEGFKRLFGKFITSKGPSVQWERIEKLPQDAVSRAHHLVYFIPLTNWKISLQLHF